MDVDLNEIEGLLAKATQGEWFEGGWGGICQKPSHKGGSHPGPRGDDPCVYTKVKYDGRGIASDNGDAVVSTEYDELVLSDGDAALIVALRNAAPSLIATARQAQELREENERLQNALADLSSRATAYLVKAQARTALEQGEG